MGKKCSPKEKVHICFFFLTKIEMLIKNLARTSKNKTLSAVPHPLCGMAVVYKGFFFSCPILNCLIHWIVWFQFKLLVSVSQLCTALSNLFLLGISIWNEAFWKSLIDPKQTSVPSWWFNRSWLNSKKKKKISSKLEVGWGRRMRRIQWANKTQALSRDANIVLFETASV